MSTATARLNTDRTEARPVLPRTKQPVPPLVNGDSLDAEEFLRRYEAAPDIKKAELIDGVVFIMASPLRAEKHGDQDNLMQGVLWTYSMATPGVRASSNATTRLGPKDIPQPDISLRYTPERSGREQFDSKGYLKFPPELIVEIAATSTSIDLNRKRESYRRRGVLEYIAWCTEEPGFYWWVLERGQYQLLRPGADGILRSKAFPGFWLDPQAILNDDRGRVMAVLELGLKSQEHAAFAKAIARK